MRAKDISAKDKFPYSVRAKDISAKVRAKDISVTAKDISAKDISEGHLRKEVAESSEGYPFPYSVSLFTHTNE